MILYTPSITASYVHWNCLSSRRNTTHTTTVCIHQFTSCIGPLIWFHPSAKQIWSKMENSDAPVHCSFLLDSGSMTGVDHRRDWKTRGSSNLGILSLVPNSQLHSLIRRYFSSIPSIFLPPFSSHPRYSVPDLVLSLSLSLFAPVSILF